MPVTTTAKLRQPSPERIARARLTEFAARLAAAYGAAFPDYAELWRWTIDNKAAFWKAVWDYAGIVGEAGTRVLVDADRMPGARFVPDARLNFAENLLAPSATRVAAGRGADALVFRGEDRVAGRTSDAELLAAVSRVQQSLAALGVVTGDRVAAYLPNLPEAIVAALPSVERVVVVPCFALGAPTLPVWRGELQCRGLGMAVDVFDAAGRPLRGDKGELVCTAPFPSMPVGFWNDPDGAKYRAAYFERFPGVWCHGDYVELTEHDGLVIYGRSDATLNPGGVRIGTAEIYRQVEALPEVLESLVIGQDWPPGEVGDQRVVLFVRLREGLALDAALVERIRQQIRTNTTPRHVPAKVVQVTDIPRTKSNKIVELAVRNVVHGREVKNAEALANPEALEQYRDREELKT